MLLESRGQLGLDNLLALYLPGLPRGVTIRQLLWHTAGLPEYLSAIPWSEDLDTEAAAASLLGRRRRFAPGARFEYCNSNYVVLARIVEMVAGQPFPSFMEEHFFGPLGMTSTQVLQPSSGYARGYEDGELLEQPNRISGDGGVWSNLVDMETWVRSLATGSAMFESGRLRDGSPIGYGFGMNIEPDSFWHGGSWAGYRNLVYWSRTRDLQIVALSNNCNSDHWPTVNAVLAEP
jgi:CubicO group peptidase (beta-lactamase class C family)